MHLQKINSMQKEKGNLETRILDPPKRKQETPELPYGNIIQNKHTRNFSVDPSK